jgi:hypothetical protein
MPADTAPAHPGAPLTHLEQRALRVVEALIREAELIPVHAGGGYRLDTERLYREVLRALAAENQNAS